MSTGKTDDNNRVLCGVRCDQKAYIDFSMRKYKVPHDFNGDGERTLHQIEFFSRCKDYQRDYPEFVDAYKKICETAAKEIRSYYAARDGREEFKVMKHENFSGYLQDLQEIYAKSAPERARLKDKLEMARKKWTQAETENRHDEYSLTRAKMDWMDAQREYKEGCAELQKRTVDQVKAVENEFRDHINDFYSANGCRLDDATVRLLNSGIRLTENEINGMVMKNTGNVTMLRLISDHCEKNSIDNEAARIYGTVARRNGADEMKAFSGVVNMIEKAVGIDERTADVWSPARGHFERLVNEQIAVLDNLTVKPADWGGVQE